MNTDAGVVKGWDVWGSVVGILFVGVGVGLAMGNVRWGVVGGDASGMAWMYGNVGLMMMWFLGWPVVGRRVDGVRMVEIFLAVLPVMGVAGLVSGVNGGAVVSMGCLQVAMGIFTLGMMRSCGKWAVGILAVIGVVMPAAGYVALEFFGSGREWLCGVPGFAVVRCAGGEVSAGFWWAVGSYFLAGVGIMGLRRIYNGFSW